MGVSRASSVGPSSTNEAVPTRGGKRVRPWVIQADLRPPIAMNLSNTMLGYEVAEADSVREIQQPSGVS